jgi:hypothetical protein
MEASTRSQTADAELLVCVAAAIAAGKYLGSVMVVELLSSVLQRQEAELPAVTTYFNCL